MRLPTRLLRRRLNSNKGDFGRIFILAGSARFSGAALLCGLSALRCGAGMVTLGIPRSINNALIKVKPAELMTFPLADTPEGGISLSAYRAIRTVEKKNDIFVIGPGLGQEKPTKALVLKLITSLDNDLVIDADGLNALAGNLEVLHKRRDAGRALILTPHSAEMSRLIGTTVKEVEMNRLKNARDFAARHKLILVLKGHKTVVSDNCARTYINHTGNPGMATAGSGDVLAGMIAGLLGQGLSAFESAKYAVFLHGLAGDLAAKEKTQISLIASDIIDKIPSAIKGCGYCRRSSVGRAAVL